MKLTRYTSLFGLAFVAACGDSSTATTSNQGGAAATSDTAANDTATSSNGATSSAAASGSSSTGAGPATIASKHPGDVGIDTDPDVVWSENFEEGDTAKFFARYDDGHPTGFAFDADSPPKSSGKASGKLTADSAGPNAVDFFKELSPGYDEIYVRWYAKYEANGPWHHTGVWFGGYDPATPYANPQAGLKPNGDDRFEIAFEPAETAMPTPRMDFYNYWMKMHSWMDDPMGDTAYYGNAIVHDPTVTAKASWQCFESHLKLGPDASSGSGSELELWVDDALVQSFNDTSPVGYWVKDKFCPDAAVGAECTDYKPASPTLVPLDQQYRSTTDLKIDYFWPQNYITDNGSASVWYDDMVVAKSRIGCIQ